MTTVPDLIRIAGEIARARVLCIGDVILDRFVSGVTERISPEAPVPVLRITEETAMLGGAGNVARNVAAMGGHVTLVSLVGDDAAGREIAEALDGLGTARSALVTEAGRPTIIKTRFIAGTQQMLRTDAETAAPLSDAAAKDLLAAATAAMADHDVVVLSDYGKGVLADGRAATLIDAARAAGKPVVVDPKGVDYGLYRGASLITPNRKELQEATQKQLTNRDRILNAASALRAELDLGAVLVTLSQDGMILVEAEDAAHAHLPAKAQEVFDVSGAGDTVVATVAAAMAAGASLIDAAHLANVTAGIVVGKVGTAAAHPEDVIAALHHQDISRAEEKLLTHEQARDRAEIWRRQGLKVGFTNGCFDLLHPGHVSLLNQAAKACDRLIVALNSDTSVKRLKGAERPIQGEAARATVLASLAAVDVCVLFDDDTPLALIKLLKPDVLVKGADYTEDQVVGAPEVKSWGGRVVLATLEDGFSTTATIARMAAGGAGDAD